MHIIILGLTAVIAVASVCLFLHHDQAERTITFQESSAPLDNPLTGYAPPAENVGECEDSRLVYIGLTWAVWEPEPGEYDTEALEEMYHISRWKEEGKHGILRFLCDLPGEEDHMDIPDWLYDRTGDGVFYDTSYGQGYAPDYSNAYLRERHRLALEALADYFGGDAFVAYIELGSLGHWGEWHTNTDEGLPPLPDAGICQEYVADYQEYFPEGRLLMRRNYTMAAEGGMGLYNDMTGSPEATREWLGWIREGGSFETAGAPLKYRGMEEFWEVAPCGGEFTSAYPMEELLGERLSETRQMIRESHMTFLGPKCPEGSEKEAEGADLIREELGYRYYISRMEIRRSHGPGQMQVELTWENTGIAPIYWDWPVTLYVYDGDGNLRHQEETGLRLSKLLPGETAETLSQIPFTEDLEKGCQIGIGITDPQKRVSLYLAMESERRDQIQIIYTEHERIEKR